MSPGPDGTAPSPVPASATQYLVAMRDGVRLATDVYLPPAGSPVPAVLVRLPYDKNSRYVFMAQVARRLTARGYALVVQDVRGKYRSEGAPSSLWYDLMVPRTIPVPVYCEGHPHQARPVPTLHCVGWFDNVATLSMRDYMKLAASPSAGPYQYLYADSHDHENYHLAKVPIQPADDHDTDDAALERMLDGYLGPAIDFFDVFLLEATGAAAPPRVRWHLGHAGNRESPAWPPPESRPLALYLTGLAGAAGSGGVLSAGQPAAAESCEWDYDPGNLVKSTIENSFAFVFEYPDESAVARHPNVLVFESEAQPQPLDLAGPVDLFVRVASSAPTADIYAKLCDRAPDGSIHQIVRGQGVLTQPGSGSLARIELGHTGYRLRPGHRLHLQIASSDYPEFPPNSGTTENRWTAARRAGSRQVLHTDPARASHLVLTVVSP